MEGRNEWQNHLWPKFCLKSPLKLYTVHFKGGGWALLWVFSLLLIYFKPILGPPQWKAEMSGKTIYGLKKR